MNKILRRLALAVFAAPILVSAARADDAAPAVSTAAAPAPVKKWKDSAEGSFVNTNGNSKTSTTAGKDNFSYDFTKRDRLEIEGGGLGARSQSQVTAEQYYAGEKTQRRFDDADYLFEKYRWDKNRFAGVVSRQEFSLGVGRPLWKTKTNLLTFEAAPGYLNEVRTGSSRISAATSRAYSKYAHDFTATSKFSQDIEYIQNLDDKRDSRINTETDLVTELSTHFAVKTSFNWKRSTRPPPGFAKDDEITSFALIANF
jgi:putative salt-induced outer membrane protein YdiY